MGRRSARIHPGLRQWAMLTRACLALRRAGIRAEHPELNAAQIERRLRAELDTHRRLQLAHYRRNG